MKKIISVVILLIIAAAAVPAIDGVFAKRSFTNYIQQVSANPRLHIKVINYQQGWLTSHAKIQVSFSGKQMIKTNALEPVVEVNSTICHGPVIFDRATKTFSFGLATIKYGTKYPLEVQMFLPPKNRTLPMMKGRTMIGFNGDIKNHMYMLPVQIEGLNAAWNGLTGDNSINMLGNNTQSIKSRVVIGAVNIAITRPVSLRVVSKPITIITQGTIDAIGLWIGASKFSLPSLEVTNPENKSIAINDWQMYLKTELNAKGLYTLNYIATLKKLDMPGNDIENIAPANITISVNDLRPKELMSLVALLNKTPGGRQVNHLSSAEKQQISAVLAKVFTANSACSSTGDLSTSLGKLQWQGKLDQLAFNPTLEKWESKAALKIKVAEALAKKLIVTYVPYDSLQAQASAPAAPVATPVATTNTAATIELFDEKVAALMKEGKIPLQAAMEIMALQKNNYPLEKFTASLDAYHLDAAVEKELTDAYGLIVVKKVEVAAVKPASELVNSMIEQWVQEGRVTRDQGDLLIDVVVEKGVMQVGGKVLN